MKRSQQPESDYHNYQYPRETHRLERNVERWGSTGEQYPMVILVQGTVAQTRALEAILNREIRGLYSVID
jgi:hypothetical protein